MANKAQKLAVGGVVGLLAVFSGPVANADEQPLTITVHLVNHAHVANNDLLLSESQVTRIYEAIGISLRWVPDTHEPEWSTPGTFHVRMLLLSGEQAIRMVSVQQVNDEVLGLAVGGAREAYIFCSRIFAAVSDRGMHFGGVLGRAIAHELGHILLPSLQGHSDVGIMRASTLVRTDRLEFFTDKQGVLIRTFLTTASQSRGTFTSGTVAAVATR
jgi:hypothetical protein